MTTRVCAVCGKTKSVSKFGNGITVPKTTCLRCKVIESAEIENEYPDEKYFRVGEIVTIKEQLFRVKSVKPKELRLKLWHKTIRTVKGELL